MSAWHFGRSFNDTRLEDNCPCVKASCGLVETVDQACEQHPMQLARTIRQSHLAKDCPGFANAISRELDTAFEGFFGALDSIATKHGLNSREFIRHIDGRGSDEAYEEWMQETWEPLTESGPQ